MNSILKYILLLTALVFLTNCSGSKPEKDYDYEAHLKKGKELIEKKKYLKAQGELSQLAVRGMHTDIGDDALFYLGEAYFLNKDYIMAISEYDRLIRKISFSEFNEKARWRICESYIALSPPYYRDQEYSIKALEKVQEFLDDYPYSEYAEEAKKQVTALRNKQSRKYFESGVLYTKLGAYDSAILSFENVLNTFYDTKYADKSRFWIIKSAIKMNDIDLAEEKLNEFASSFNNQELFASASDLLKQAIEKENRK